MNNPSHVVHEDYPRGVLEVFDTRRYSAAAADIVTCGACGRSWNDHHSSGWTPAPSGRCPFEYDHRSLR